MAVNNLSETCLLQSLDYTDTADVKPERGRKSIIQNPCYHHITSVTRTLPRQSKKLPRGHSSGITETNRIQSVNVSLLNIFKSFSIYIVSFQKYFGCKGEKISRVRALVESFENSALCKVYQPIIVLCFLPTHQNMPVLFNWHQNKKK